MATEKKRYAITAESTENYRAIMARLQGLGTSVVSTKIEKKRIIADIGLESTILALQDMGAKVEAQWE